MSPQLPKRLSDNKLERLVENGRSGDSDAEEELFEYLRERFVAIAKRRVKEGFAEDIAHDACLTVFEKYKVLPKEKELAPWIYTVLRNKVGNHLRDSKSKDSVVSYQGSMEEYPTLTHESEVESSLQLRLCLKELRVAHPRYIRALNLISQGFTAREVCDRIGTSVNNLYVMLHRGRKKLHKCLTKE